MRNNVSEPMKQRIRKLLSLSDTKAQCEFFRSMDLHKMDEDLIRTFIVHSAHNLDKATKGRWVEGREIYYRNKLINLIKVWHEKNFNISDDIRWAERILDQYNIWDQEKKPIRSDNRLEENKEKDIYKVIRQRRSIRYFEKMDIENEKLMKVLESGRWAPCSGNRQAWKFIVQRRIKGAYIAKEDLSFEREEWRAGSVIIYVAIDERLYPEKFTPAMDAAAAIQNMLLMAHSLGLGGCWMYMSELTNQNNLKNKLGLDDYYYIYSAVLLGYPAEHPEPPHRKPLEKCVKFIGFGDNDA